MSRCSKAARIGGALPGVPSSKTTAHSSPLRRPGSNPVADILAEKVPPLRRLSIAKQFDHLIVFHLGELTVKLPYRLKIFRRQ